MKAPILAALALAATVTSPSRATPPLPPDDAAAIVRELIWRGGQACAQGDPAGAMAAVDRELVVSYPGIPDIGYAELEAGYRGLCRGDAEGTVASTIPEFDEVSQNGDIIVARLTWNTHLRGMPEGTTRKLRDFQVWRRTAQGWRFWRGVHWPIKALAL